MFTANAIAGFVFVTAGVFTVLMNLERLRSRSERPFVMIALGLILAAIGLLIMALDA